MICIYDINLVKLLELGNAYDVVEETVMNGIDKLRFSLPYDDHKRAQMDVMQFVRIDDEGQLYRIFRYTEQKTNGEGSATYECEHAVVTLLDEMIIDAVQLDNLTTRQCIEYVLSRQTRKNWRLNRCDFSHRFSYAWRKDRLIHALMSIPNPFTEAYIWAFDTSIHPWQINLVQLHDDAIPDFYAREGHNLITMTKVFDAANMVTRLHAYGNGDGDNTTNFTALNGGRDYLDAGAEAITKYGIKESEWTDERYIHAESLLERARVLINGLSKPFTTIDIKCIDFARITGQPHDAPEVGKLTQVENLRVRICKYTHHHDPGKESEDTLQLANAPQDLAGTITELSNRLRGVKIDRNGATNMYTACFKATASPASPARIYFFIPENAEILNRVRLRIELRCARSNVRGVQSGGAKLVTSSTSPASSQSSSSGGGTNTSTNDGGGTQVTSGGGGGSQVTSSGGGATTTSSTSGGGTHDSTSTQPTQSSTAGPSTLTVTQSNYQALYSTQTALVSDYQAPSFTTYDLQRHYHQYTLHQHSHGMDHTHYFSSPAHNHQFSVPQHAHQITIYAHTHGVDIPSHTHSVSTPAHRHSFTVPAHTHSVPVPEHNHSINLPTHAHELEYGVFENNVNATSMVVKLNGVVMPMTSPGTMDIAPALIAAGALRKGQEQVLEITPDQLCDVEVAVTPQFFILSQGAHITEMV